MKLYKVVALALLVSCSADAPSSPADTVARIDVSAATTTIAPAQTVQLSATAFTSGNQSVPSASFTWTSSAVSVATVNSSGVVTGVAAGAAIIRVASGTAAATLAITVISGAGVLSTVVVTTPDTQLELAQGTQATVEGRDNQGGVVALGPRVVTWSSSNATVATVSGAGGVNGVGIGSATITASVQDGTTARTGSVLVTVNPIPNAPTVTDVAMATERFIPYQSVVKLNGTVQFQFTSIDHNVIWTPRSAGSPADILVTVNATVSRTFNTVGVFPFACTIHPGMNGIIVVTP